MYLDSDYKDHKRDFTLDKKDHADLPQLIEETHKKGLRWNFIIDPHVAAYDYPGGKDYPPFTDGYNNDVFVKWDKSVPKDKQYNPTNAPLDRDVFYGRGIPDDNGPIAFPDFFKTKTRNWFNRSLSRLRNDLGIKFDALWIVIDSINTFM